MALNITPAGSSPEKSGTTTVKYAPVRSALSMTGNTAPIPGEPGPTAPAAPAAQSAETEPADKGGTDGDLAWRLGVVAKKDQKARERLDAAKAAEARVRQLEQQIASREAALAAEEQKRAIWRRDPKTLLADHGFVPEAAVQYMLNGEKLTPEQQLAATLDEKLAAERAERERSLQALREEQEKQREREEQEAARRRDQELSLQEQAAVDDLKADIGTIIGEDRKAFALVAKAGQRGVDAIFDRVNELSDLAYQQTGRRPPVTTKMLERAAAEIEQAARKEYQETVADPDISAALGLAPARARPNTLTNDMRRAAPQPTAQQGESEAEKRERVKSYIAAALAGGRAR